MSNSFVTCKEIAREALPLLVEECSLLPLIYRGYDEAFTHKKGDTIQVQKPTRGDTVDGSADISSGYQDVGDDPVEVTLDTQRAYPVSLSSQEMTLNLDSFTRQISLPAMSAIAKYINGALLDLYVDIPYFVGTSGNTPDALDDLANSRKMLNNNLAPRGNRACIFDNDADAKFLALDSLVEVDKAGTNQALRNAALGQVYGMILASDGEVKTHTAGGYTALADVTCTAGAAEATSIELTSAAGTSTAKLENGDIFTLDGYQYVVTAQTAAASSGVIAAVTIYPGLHDAYGDMDSDAVTFADVSAGAHVANLAFHKNAFALAMAMLEPARGAESATASYKGVAMRVVQDYLFGTDKHVIRFDVLFGVKTMYPELATRLLG